MEFFDAFDLAVTYDKPTHTLDLSVLLCSDPERRGNTPNAVRPPEGRSYHSSIAGAGFERICATRCRYRERHDSRSLSQSLRRQAVCH